MNILRVMADNMSSQEKIERLKKYDVELTKKQEEEVSRMCDYGAYVESIGIEKGIKEGLRQGSENKTIEDIQSLTKTLKLSVDEAMDALQISAEEKSYYLKLLNEKVNA